MDVNHYLERIGYRSPLYPDLQTLFSLLRHHVHALPFENIDIQCGVPIVLNTDSFYQKIIERKRGGYCYELNGLFHQLLLHIGFDAHLISCRVAKGKNYSDEYDHLALLVNCEDRTYLVDAGFGNFSLQPLLLGANSLQNDGWDDYRIQEKLLLDGEEYYSVERLNKATGQFQPEYYFTISPQTLKHFEPRNTYQQTSPESHFTQNLICSIPTENGRVSIVNNKLIITENGLKQEKRVSAHELVEILETYFSMQQQHLPGVSALKFHAEMAFSS